MTLHGSMHKSGIPKSPQDVSNVFGSSAQWKFQVSPVETRPETPKSVSLLLQINQASSTLSTAPALKGS